MSFGSSFFERALADAAARLAGADAVALLRQDLLEIRPAAGAPRADARRSRARGRLAAPETLAVRHTVGLLDPIVAADVPADGWLRDGLPQTLEECVRAHGLRHFKLKVGGRLGRRPGAPHPHRGDARPAHSPTPTSSTLDGNEQYKTLRTTSPRSSRPSRRRPALARSRRSIAFIEQPLDRAVALDAAATEGLAALGRRVPIIIDESDGELEAFTPAVALGYRGVSTKNCKGIIKSFLNRSLVERRNASASPSTRNSS